MNLMIIPNGSVASRTPRGFPGAGGPAAAGGVRARTGGTGAPDPPFIAIPAFTSRAFRHNGVYVSTGSGINSPADLRGRTVGVAEYQLTANVWIRGIMAEHSLPLSVLLGRHRAAGAGEVARIPPFHLITAAQEMITKSFSCDHANNPSQPQKPS